MSGINWQGWLDKIKARADIASSVVTLALIAIGGIVFAWLLASPVVPSGVQPVGYKKGCTTAARPSHAAMAQPVKVSDASGPKTTLNLFTGRGGDDQTRQSVPLAIQKGRLCPGETLTASVRDLARSDGQILPTNQVAAWGLVDNTGTHVTIWVHVNPRYGHVSGFGSYSGSAYLNDSSALGGNVPIDIHVLYPNTSFVLVFGLIAAFAGFTWAWLVHELHNVAENRTSQAREFFWRNMILRIAVLLVAAIPIVNAQVLTNPDWRGDLTQYIALATLAGGAAIALTPTFRTLALPPRLSRDTEAGADEPDPATGTHAASGTQ
jgi:hypothetical protein